MGKTKLKRKVVVLVSTLLLMMTMLSTTIFAADSMVKSNADNLAKIVSKTGGFYHETYIGKVVLTYSESTRQIIFKYTEKSLNHTISFAYDTYSCDSITQITYDTGGNKFYTEDFKLSGFRNNTVLKIVGNPSDDSRINNKIQEAFVGWEQYLNLVGLSWKALGAEKYSAPAKCSNHNKLKTTITPATTKLDGFEGKICPVCGYSKGNTIYKIGNIKLSDTAFVENGKAQKPKVTVYDANNNVISSENYTVSYNNNVNTGVASAIVKFSGYRYSGNKTAVFSIVAAKKNTYYIKFDGNGATSGSMNNMECKLNNSLKLSANKYERNGYSFIGWNTAKDGSGKSYKNSATSGSLTNVGGKTIVLYAQWKIIKYNITYKLNGGKNNSSNPTTYTIEKGVTLKNPTKSGVNFAGWYTDSALTNKVTGIAKGKTGNITLYAKWQKKPASSNPIAPKVVAFINDNTHQTHIVDVTIKNNGSKSLTIRKNAEFYPTGSMYSYAAKLEGDNLNSDGNMVIKPGATKTLHFTLNDYWYITSFSALIFDFDYDGVAYKAVIYRDITGSYTKVN